MSDNLREIGGYFGLEEFSGTEYHDGLIGVNSGRNALLYIIKSRKIKKLFIPAFLCDTVYKLCERENCEYEFYHIDSNFRPVFTGDLRDGEWLYIVNFYGQISNDEIIRFKSRYGNVIFDNVQDFFRKPVKGIDTIYSCRKFFGVPDGGYVSTDVVLEEPLEIDYSADRMTHILGRFEKSGSEFYSFFQENDENFYDLGLKSMSRITKNILKAVDYDSVISVRNENYEYLHNTLGNYNKLNLISPNGAYCYPFYCENGMEIKRKLAKIKIYIPTLWPDVSDNGNELETSYAENILPIPCDQRYNKEDMDRILKEMNVYEKFWRK